MTRRLLKVLAVMALATASACASTKGPISPADRTTISREELAERPAASLLDVISATRPTWLRALPGATGRAAITPIVYVDGRPVGGVDVLQSISTGAVESIRHLSASEAQNRYSMLQARPVIDIRSRSSSG